MGPWAFSCRPCAKLRSGKHKTAFTAKRAQNLPFLRKRLVSIATAPALVALMAQPSKSTGRASPHARPLFCSGFRLRIAELAALHRASHRALRCGRPLVPRQTAGFEFRCTSSPEIGKAGVVDWFKLANPAVGRDG
jgi:hypothetical protein